MINAVTASLIVALFCSALIALWYSNRLIIDDQEQKNQLIEAHQIAVQQFLMNYREVISQDHNYPSFKHLGIQTEYFLKPWGMYKVLTAKSFIPNDSITKSFLLGNTIAKNPDLELYLTDRGKPLKYSGKVSFSKDIQIPNSHIKNHFLPKVKNKLKRNGKLLSSTAELPKLNLENVYPNLEQIDVISIDQVMDEGGILIQGFDQPTKIITVPSNAVVGNITLKGNIILESNAPLFIAQSAQLNDLIIKAPEVIFEADFSGNVQVIAFAKVILSENTILDYPSSIYVHNDQDSIQVSFKENTLLMGGLIVHSNSNAQPSKRHLAIHSDSKIIGDVFCNGIADFRGKLYGTAYIQQFEYKTTTTTVDNLLVDAAFVSDSIPSGFTRLSLTDDPIIQYDIIKEL